MGIQNYKAIHFIGAGGSGVSALARLSRLLDKNVSGSDMRESAATESLRTLGCAITIGHAAENIPNDVDLVVHTEDVNETSSGFVELSEAKKRGITTLRYSEALGLFLEDYYGIGVSGTNGKSTTTALLGLIMEKGGTDPMVVLGSRLAKANESDAFKTNARFGKGKYFVFEADEYHRHMLDSKPRAAVITNIEADHLDYYKDLEDINSAFADYINQLPEDGFVVYNSDDKNNAQVCTENGICKKYCFAMHDDAADYKANILKIENQKQVFAVTGKGRDLGIFELSVPGSYNVMNALGAIAAALELGADLERIREAVSEFAGIWRRFETVGVFQGKPVISDYAHHPTAVTGLLQAAKEFYPDKKILFVYQPHQKNRTKLFMKDFVQSLLPSYELIVSEIYFVPGREKAGAQAVSSKQIVDALARQGKVAAYAEDLDQTEAMIRAKAADVDVILLAGAGTIDQLARKLAGK
jgi:UDP-N-acetylmuramate--alanine ligase